MPPTLLIKGNLKYPLNKENEVPMNYILNWLKERDSKYNINFKVNSVNDRILILKSTTGTGKSTVMPTEIFRLLRSKKNKISDIYKGRSVICTQPRVMNAISIATEQATAPYNPDLSLNVVGYQTSAFKHNPLYGGLIYATIGTLSAQFSMWSDEDIINKYAYIIIDEVHEQSLGADLLLWNIKKFINRCVKNNNKYTPFVICTSATLDVNKYASYFGVSKETNIMSVEGLSYPITDIFSKIDYENVYEESAKKAIEIHTTMDLDNINNDKIDILIFVPGGAETKYIKDILEKKNKELFNNGKHIYRIIVINREEVQSKSIEYLDALENKITDIKVKIDDTEIIPQRRIIITGNVAETGITFPNLKYVIETGWQRTKESYPPYNITGLLTKPAKQSNIKQRKGRVGRIMPGICYRMYTEKTYNVLDPQEYPETIKSGIKEIILPIINIIDRDINNIDLIDNPSNMSILEALELAITLGYIDEKYDLTELGKIAKNVSTIPLEYFRIICAGYVFEVPIVELVNILAPTLIEKKPKINKIKNNYFIDMKVPVDELLNKCLKNINDLKWLDTLIDNMANYKYNKVEKTLLDCIYSNNNIYDNIINVGLKIFTKNKKYDDLMLEHCLYDGFKKNLIVNNKNRHNIDVKINNKFKNDNKYIITNSLNIKSDIGDDYIYNVYADICCSLSIPIDDDIYDPSPLS